MKAVIFASWGKPKGRQGWCMVEYGLEVDEELSRVFPAPEGTWSGRSATGFLASLCEESHVVVFAPWTLGIGGELLERGVTPRSLLERAERYVREAAEDPEYIPQLPSIHVRSHALPAIGVFKDGDGNVWRFRGGLGFLYAGSFLQAFEVMEELRPDVVLLDLSHGMNYIPAILKDSVFLATLLYASRLEGGSVHFLAFNSDPVTAQGEKVFLHPIEGVELSADVARERLWQAISWAVTSSSRARLYRFLDRERAREVSKRYGKEIKEFSRFAKIGRSIVKAVSNGLVLYLAQYLPGDVKAFSRYEGRLREALKTYERDEAWCRIERGEGRVDVNALIDINREAVYLYALASLLKSLPLRGVAGGEDGIGLSQLAELADAFSFSAMVKIIAKAEISNVKARVEKLASECFGGRIDQFIPYSAVYDATRFVGGEVKVYCENLKPPDAGSRGAGPDPRNFLAHAGLEKNLIEVRFSDGEVYVRYRDRKSVESVIERLK